MKWTQCTIPINKHCMIPASYIIGGLRGSPCAWDVPQVSLHFLKPHYGGCQKSLGRLFVTRQQGRKWRHKPQCRAIKKAVRAYIYLHNFRPNHPIKMILVSKHMVLISRNWIKIVLITYSEALWWKFKMAPIKTISPIYPSKRLHLFRKCVTMNPTAGTYVLQVHWATSGASLTTFGCELCTQRHFEYDHCQFRDFRRYPNKFFLASNHHKDTMLAFKNKFSRSANSIENNLTT